MSERIPVRSDPAPAPGDPYSPAIRSGFVFLAGQGPFRPDGWKVEESFQDLPGFEIEVDAVVAMDG